MTNKFDYLTASQVANKLGVSVKTLTTWYAFYNDSSIEKPKNMPQLPMYVQEHVQGPRYWNKADIEKLKKFRDWVPRGRNGVMGSINNKYWKKKGSKSDE